MSTNVSNMNSKIKLNISKKKDTSPKNKLNIVKKKSKSKKSVSEIYVKMKHIDHIFEKPDSYVGSIEIEETEQYVLDDTNMEEIKIVKKQFNYCPGFYKCFDELLVNAFDHTKRQLSKIKGGDNSAIPVTNIKVEIDKDSGIISVFNDGDGIDIEIIPEHNKYPPEMIFGELLTSTNYDDSEEREWGGRNGYGAKLANIFSTETQIETVDSKRGKKFKQIFKNHMSEKSKPKITSFSGKPYTKLTWSPDYKKFNMEGLDSDHLQLFKKRVYDIAACTDSNVAVYLNKNKINNKTFEKYVDLFIGDKKDKPRIYEESNGWKVIASYNDDEVFEQVSFVNGINTVRGGKHVDHIVDQIKDKLSILIKKKKKVNVKSSYVKNQLMVFVNSTIINPVFDGQTKETLKTNKSKFGNSITLSDKFIQKLFKTDITERIIQQTTYKESQSLQKTDGKKKTRVKVPKLSDANNAGRKNKSRACTLILTEGDSAKTMAVAGLSVVGRDNYGVFPLRGKVLNVRDASNQSILNNTEISNVKQILGLQSNKIYTKEECDKEWPLRYGKIMIMTDQDHDGSHIKGLVMNLFDHMWPSLLDIGFVCSMVTPIIKVKKKKAEKSFYTIQDYEKWKQTNNNGKGWNVKYYKGLGTSTTSEAKDYFKELRVITYERHELLKKDNVEKFLQEGGDQKTLPENKLDLAFNKKRADDRKQWLFKYDRDSIADFSRKKMTFNEFIDDEMIHFSNESNDRSIPSVRDGFKPSIRKIMFSAFKRNLTKEIKVAQLAGYVSENAAYHHGEKSLEGAIVGLAHNFIGSNNLNLLVPNGQFGSRLQGGKDAAQSRYIFTLLSPLTRKIFLDNDDALLDYLDDDGIPIEPEAYCGIIPMVLVNGAEGIGTGFSTTIPCYNPLDLIKVIKNKLADKDSVPIKPWYRGFNGTIKKIESKSYLTKGTYKVISKSEIIITELPIGVWTERYIEHLEKCMIEKGKENTKHFIKSYEDNSTESTVSIKIKFNSYSLTKFQNKANKENMTYLESILKLTSRLSTNNMWLFDTDNKIKKYSNVEEIIDEWYIYRYNLYVKRKEYLLKKLRKELNIIKYKVKFINEFIAGSIEIRNKSKANVIKMLEDNNYPKLCDKIDANESENSFDYILKMDLYKLTKEEIEKLTKKRDDKQVELDDLEKKEISEIWKDELNDLETLYLKDLKIYQANPKSNKKKKKKIKYKNKSKKSKAKK